MNGALAITWGQRFAVPSPRQASPVRDRPFASVDSGARAEAQSRLLLACADGDTAAFAALYRHAAPRLLSMATYLLRDPGRAEEVLQDAFVAIWQHASDYHPDRASAFTWMASVVRNRCFDLMRTSAFTHGPARNTTDADEWLARCPDPGPDPAGARERQQDGAQVSAAMRTLPGPYRQALTLAYVEGCSHAELAERLQVPVGTAKSWVRRGLHQLRKAFESANAD